MSFDDWYKEFSYLELDIATRPLRNANDFRGIVFDVAHRAWDHQQDKIITLEFFRGFNRGQIKSLESKNKELRDKVEGAREVILLISKMDSNKMFTTVTTGRMKARQWLKNNE